LLNSKTKLRQGEAVLQYKENDMVKQSVQVIRSVYDFFLGGEGVEWHSKILQYKIVCGEITAKYMRETLLCAVVET